MINCVECDFSYNDGLSECPRCNELESNERPKLVSVAAMTAEFVAQKAGAKLGRKIGILWPKNDDISFNLITEVEKKFKGKNKFHSYFSENTATQSAPNILKKYISNKVPFIDLVTSFMDSLVTAAQNVGAHKVAGGNILFMHYKSDKDNDDIGRLLAIWVTKKSGFDFHGEGLLPKDSSHLNLDAMRQAALFDLTLFDEVYPAVPDEETYLKFIKGTSTGEFFKTAFGCEEINTGNVDSIKNLRQALTDFQDRHKLGNDFYSDSSNKIESLLGKAQKSGKPISLSTLCNAIDGQLPDGSPLKGTFKDFINNNSYQINQHIEPTPNSVKAGLSIEIIANDKSFSAKILKKEIGSSGSGNLVEYEDGRLTFIIDNKDQQRELEKLTSVNSKNE